MSSEQPVIRPFAIMRLTHEALRVGIREVREALVSLVDEKGDSLALRSCLNELLGCLDVHREQEDKRFFTVLNEQFDDVIDKEGIPREHVDDIQEMGNIKKLLEGYENGTNTEHELGHALEAWMWNAERHLEHEEAVMMPLTEKIAPTVEERAAEVHKILEVDMDGFRNVQLGYVVRQLSRSDQFGKLRAFVDALKTVASADEYQDFATIIEDHAEPAHREELYNAGLL